MGLEGGNDMYGLDLIKIGSQRAQVESRQEEGAEPVGSDYVETVSERPSDEGQASELSFDDRVEKVRIAVHRSPLHREILYKLLMYCREARLLKDAEEEIASYPEFREAGQAPYILMTYLIKADGLEVFELDSAGAVITDEQKIGLNENELDDLIADFAYQSTEAGLAAAYEMSPEQRLNDLLGVTPAYYDTYLEVLGFLSEKRSFADVDQLLRGRDALYANCGPGDRPVQPSIFIDKLERAGVIFWDEGWLTTEEGIQLREALNNRESENG